MTVLIDNTAKWGVRKLTDFQESTVINLITEATELGSKGNGWYKFSGVLSGIDGNWMINKIDTLYVANNIDDPRIVLNSVDKDTWYSPYAYWHA